MKLLVLGAGGMAGHVVATHFREREYDVETISSTKPVFGDTTLLDVTNQAAFFEYLEGRDYSAIVNCIGILVKQSEEQKDLSTYLNSYLPHMLEARYRNTATKIIHLSTDCVFSGKNAPYTEDALYDGELFYDRTKALGEIKNDKDLTLRMSIIGPDMSPTGTGLFNWFMSQSGNINGYSKSIWNGVTTIELARAIEAAISQNVAGLYHLVPSDNISKFELLKLFKEVFEHDDITINPVEGAIADKTLVNTRGDFDITIPSYPVMIQQMKEWIDRHKGMYNHYER